MEPYYETIGVTLVKFPNNRTTDISVFYGFLRH